MLGREVCFCCRKPKKVSSWHCTKCTAVIKRSISANERRLAAKRKVGAL